MNEAKQESTTEPVPVEAITATAPQEEPEIPIARAVRLTGVPAEELRRRMTRRGIARIDCDSLSGLAQPDPPPRTQPTPKRRRGWSPSKAAVEVVAPAAVECGRGAIT